MEDEEIPHHDQGNDLVVVKVKIKEEEEEMLVSGDQQSMEEGKTIMKTKQEESSLGIGTDGRYVGNTSKGGPISYRIFKAENNDIRQNSPELNTITENPPQRPYGLETSKDPTNPEESSKKSDTLTSDTRSTLHTADRPTNPPKESSQSQEGLHTGESSLSCLGCGKSFKTNSELLIHLRSHTKVTILCPECGKSFTDKKVFNDHQKIHTGETPFSCSECGKYFTWKGNLITHQRIHRGERPYSCSKCGRSFTQKGHLIRHQKTHSC
ncbi:zinc finger protein 7-like [Rana temporaria]|uniref:zinc finger protein 7-like n=1 Tax=Rana temporaria TaxID=8407 RepID=UPI001AAE12C9|nr:zinc finger protein 7-like [Rana temporaria]